MASFALLIPIVVISEMLWVVWRECRVKREREKISPRTRTCTRCLSTKEISLDSNSLSCISQIKVSKVHKKLIQKWIETNNFFRTSKKGQLNFSASCRFGRLSWGDQINRIVIKSRAKLERGKKVGKYFSVSFSFWDGKEEVSRLSFTKGSFSLTDDCILSWTASELEKNK